MKILPLLLYSIGFFGLCAEDMGIKLENYFNEVLKFNNIPSVPIKNFFDNNFINNAACFINTSKNFVGDPITFSDFNKQPNFNTWKRWLFYGSSTLFASATLNLIAKAANLPRTGELLWNIGYLGAMTCFLTCSLYSQKTYTEWYQHQKKYYNRETNKELHNQFCNILVRISLEISKEIKSHPQPIENIMGPWYQPITGNTFSLEVGNNLIYSSAKLTQELTKEHTDLRDFINRAKLT